MNGMVLSKQLDKKYGDDARKILDKWDAFNEILMNYDNALKKTKPREVMNRSRGNM